MRSVKLTHMMYDNTKSLLRNLKNGLAPVVVSRLAHARTW